MPRPEDRTISFAKRSFSHSVRGKASRALFGLCLEGAGNAPNLFLRDLGLVIAQSLRSNFRLLQPAG